MSYGSGSTSAVVSTQRRSDGDMATGDSAFTNMCTHASAAIDLAGTLAALAPVPYVSTIFASLKKIVDVVNMSGRQSFRKTVSTSSPAGDAARQRRLY